MNDDINENNLFGFFKTSPDNNHILHFSKESSVSCLNGCIFMDYDPGTIGKKTDNKNNYNFINTINFSQSESCMIENPTGSIDLNYELSIDNIVSKTQSDVKILYRELRFEEIMRYLNIKFPNVML